MAADGFDGFDSALDWAMNAMVVMGGEPKDIDGGLLDGSTYKRLQRIRRPLDVKGAVCGVLESPRIAISGTYNGIRIGRRGLCQRGLDFPGKEGIQCGKFGQTGFHRVPFSVFAGLPPVDFVLFGELDLVFESPALAHLIAVALGQPGGQNARKESLGFNADLQKRRHVLSVDEEIYWYSVDEEYIDTM